MIGESMRGTGNRVDQDLTPRYGPGLGYGQGYGIEPRSAGNLADILERVLDKGLVIAGEIKVNLLDIELLTIKIRLLVTSVDTARELGIDWWRTDPWLSSAAGPPTAEPGTAAAAELIREAAR